MWAIVSALSTNKSLLPGPGSILLTCSGSSRVLCLHNLPALAVQKTRCFLQDFSLWTHHWTHRGERSAGCGCCPFWWLYSSAPCPATQDILAWKMIVIMSAHSFIMLESWLPVKWKFWFWNYCWPDSFISERAWAHTYKTREKSHFSTHVCSSDV